MDRYTFLIFTLPYLLIYLAICCFRKDLRYKLLITGVLGGTAALISEPIFFQDYWRPPTLMGVGKVSIEEFILGLSITGIASSCFEVIFRKKLVKKLDTKLILSLSLYLSGMMLFFYFCSNTQINSIFICSIGFIISAVVALLLRKDLIIPTFFSSFFITFVSVIVYTALYLYSPHFWQNYWLLYSTGLGFMIFNIIPWTEILWYISFGLIAGVYFEFTLGIQRENTAKREKLIPINPFKIIANGLKKA